MADEDQQEPQETDEGTERRLSSLETEQQRQGGLLEQILTKLSGGAPAAPQQAQDATRQGLDAKGDVAAEVRAELERIQGEQAETAKQDDIAARIARLEARPPAPPERRVEKVMWGAR